MKETPVDWKQKEKAYKERIVFLEKQLEKQLEKSKRLNQDYHTFVHSLRWLGGSKE